MYLRNMCTIKPIAHGLWCEKLSADSIWICLLTNIHDVGTSIISIKYIYGWCALCLNVFVSHQIIYDWSYCHATHWCIVQCTCGFYISCLTGYMLRAHLPHLKMFVQINPCKISANTCSLYKQHEFSDFAVSNYTITFHMMQLSIRSLVS